RAMRLTWLIVVGLGVVSCKDKEPTPAAKPAEAPPAPVQAPTPPPPTPELPDPAAVRAPAPPTLDVASRFDGEREDKVWASATASAIRAVAPDLEEVACREHHCRAVLRAASEAELVEKAEKLQAEDSLRSTEAKNILLTAPDTDDSGKMSMTIY